MPAWRIAPTGADSPRSRLPALSDSTPPFRPRPSSPNCSGARRPHWTPPVAKSMRNPPSQRPGRGRTKLVAAAWQLLFGMPRRLPVDGDLPVPMQGPKFSSNPSPGHPPPRRRHRDVISVNSVQALEYTDNFSRHPTAKRIPQASIAALRPAGEKPCRARPRAARMRSSRTRPGDPRAARRRRYRRLRQVDRSPVQ